MSYEVLRRLGIDELERLAGGQWTDFNAHDPGITLLEQLCYVLTDLGYRTAHEIPDLLAEGGAHPYRSLHLPSQILSCSPVTPADLRRVVLDVDGVHNAWVEPAAEDGDTLYYHPASNTLSLKPELARSEPVVLKGLYRVLIDPAEDAIPEGLRARVARRLHGCRALCEDFARITVLEPQRIRVEATLEMGPSALTAELEREIVRKIAEVISPPVRFRTLADGVHGKVPLEAIFEGPRLDHGFLRDDVLEHATRRTALNTSDLIRALRDVPEVQAVSSVRISTAEQWSTWSLPIASGKVPKLDRALSSITLTRGGKVVARTTGQPAAPPASSVEATGLVLPAGRDRHAIRYASVRRHLPAIYGVGEVGLPDSAPPERRAQARQLTAYLMFFDQIMADHLAQLAHVKDLFSHGEEDEDVETRTYFSQPVEQPGAATEPIHDGRFAPARRGDAAATREVERKNRFLDHLLARFAETLDDPGASSAADPAAALKALAGRKQAFLRRYERLGGARGASFSGLEAANSIERTALEQRIRLKLGLDERQPTLLVEHILLRPVTEDQIQQVPLVTAPIRKDPYSLQLTFALPPSLGPFAPGPDRDDFRAQVEHAIREETPAHLAVYVRWMDGADWDDLVAAHGAWLGHRRDYWARELGVPLEPGAPAAMAQRHLYLRSARDWIIDLLGVGETYPLQDVNVQGEQLMVSFDQDATFSIEPGQEDVRYELRDGDHVFSVEGNGGRTLLSGKIDLLAQPSRTFTLRATKLAPPEHWVDLLQTATVRIGIDPTLRAYIADLPLLNPNVADPSDTDARIAAHRTSVTVVVQDSQAEARYELVYAGPGGAEIATADVTSLGGDLRLETLPIEEDTIIRIRATRLADPPESRFLDVELPLAVRADPWVSVSIGGPPPADPAPVDPDVPVAITIAGSQVSVAYSAYVRTLRDADFAVEGLPPDRILTVPVPASLDVTGHDVRVRAPDRPDPWEVPSGYAPLAGPMPGNGGDLSLALGALPEDSVVVLLAHKDHFAAGGSAPRVTGPGTSDLQLERALVILARPTAPSAFAFTLSPDADGRRGRMRVSGGQRGVFYHLRADEHGDELGLPAYFHRRDEDDDTQNRGIGQLEIERDLAIPRDLESMVALPPPELAYPIDPVVDVQPLPGAGVSVMAVKARTGVGWAASRTFPVKVEP